MSNDPAQLFRNAIQAAKAIQADANANALGMGKPPILCAGCGLPVEDDPHVIKEWSAINAREYWHSRCFAHQHIGLLSDMPNAPIDVRDVVRRWRGVIDRRARSYLDGPGDFIGRMMLDEVAQIDAWLAEQEAREAP